MEQDEPREFHFPPLYVETRFCFDRSSELDIADFVQGFEESFCGLNKAMGDVIDDFGQVKPG